MLNPKITEAIASQFIKERFLFWYDTDKEYQPCISEIGMPNTTVVLADETPALSIKLEISLAPTTQKFLFYSTQPQPEAKYDWLLSYRLKGKSFSADATQILLDELGLASHTLRPYLKFRSKYFAAKERVERVKKWVVAHDSAESLDLKILTVIARADQPEPFEIFNQVLSSMVQDEDVRFDTLSRIWAEIEQFEMAQTFWQLAQRTFGYAAEAPTLKSLMMSLLVTDFATHLSDASALPQQISHFVLEGGLKSNAKVFISRWRSDVKLMQAYVVIALEISQELGIDKLVAEMPIEALSGVPTFDAIDRQILIALKREIGSGESSKALAMIQLRRDGFWANLKVTRDVELSKAYASCYDAIEAAFRFFVLKASYANGFSFVNAQSGLEEYKKTLFKFDQTYRQFNYAASLVEPFGWQLLHDLIAEIETAYSEWFIPQLTSAWNKLVEGEHGLLNDWKLDGWVNQYCFYDAYVNNSIQNNVKRVFVLISDAFRYEAAEELCTLLNDKNKYQANLEAMLGVLPSYTSLGMAALLPHKTLKYKRGQNLSVLADDLPTSGLDQRSAVLAQYQGVAIKHEDLLALGREKGREFIKPYQVIYIYHDRVDAIGDKQATETKTFEAVEQTIQELHQIVSFAFNSLTASTLYLTADHGFMYQESALESVDKSQLIDKPTSAMVTKKRYLLGAKLGETTQAWFGNTHVTSGTEPNEGSIDFWVPKGAARFHFAGGARFVHGSAMPQEIVVPLISIKQSGSERNKTKYVDIQRLGSLNKVVTNMQRFELIQTEPISEYVLSRTVKLLIQDGVTPISDEPVLTFNKTGQLLDELKESVILTLKSSNYDRYKDYYLIIKDVDSGVEVQRYSIKIDLAFSNEF